jgi:HD-like signal output (HDOD) protein
MSQEEYFRFVQGLAEDINRDNVKLPSFPEVVMRLREQLDNPDTTSLDIENTLSMDPVLASRMLRLANSVYHNAAGTKVESLHAAVSRVGFEPVRTAATQYALEQLHASKDLKPFESQLQRTWSFGLNLAALCESLARECTKLDFDSAFLAGLLNQVGVLYILSKHKEFPTLLDNAETRQSLIDDWVAPVGESVVANWGFSEAIQHSMNPKDKEERRGQGEPDLADVVVTAKRSLNKEDSDWQESIEAKRLQLTPEKMASVIELYEKRMESISASMG